MIWRRKLTSSESDDSDHSCTEEEKTVAKPSVRLNPTPRNKSHPRAKNSHPDFKSAEYHKVTSWDQQVKARVEESGPAGLGIEVERKDPVPESILVDAQEARNAEIQRQVQFEDGTRPRKSRKSKEGKRLKPRAISIEKSLDLEAKRIDKEARRLGRERRRESQRDSQKDGQRVGQKGKSNQKERDTQREDRETRRKEKDIRRKQIAKRMDANEHLVSSSSDAREGSSRERSLATRERKTNTRSKEGSMPHFATSDSDCRAALRHAERQRETLMQQIQTHRREQLQEAISSRSQRASNLPDLDAGEVSRRDKKRVRKHETGRIEHIAFEIRNREGDDARGGGESSEGEREVSGRERGDSGRHRGGSRRVRGVSRTPRGGSRRPDSHSRNAHEGSGTTNIIISGSTTSPQGPSESSVPTTPQDTERIPQTNNPTSSPTFSSANLPHIPTTPSESPQDRALRYVRAAERDRQRILQTPPDMYHTRIRPPPRDEYSTVDEDIPPYRAQLHKYLDLVLYDERFTPILRVNRYLVNGDHELSAAIEKLTQFNLLPKRTNLWSISHIDDNDYEQMIPVLIPETSYYSEVALF